MVALERDYTFECGVRKGMREKQVSENQIYWNPSFQRGGISAPQSGCINGEAVSISHSDMHKNTFNITCRWLH